MYGADKSIEGPGEGVDVGTVDGMTILSVKGSVGVDGGGLVSFVPGTAPLFGKESQADCISHIS